MSKLEERPWRTDILKVDGSTVYISGGALQGLKVGDKLQIFKAGETVKSSQTGFDITLPPTPVARIQVSSLFGDDETNEGATTTIIAGNVTGADMGALFVSELQR